MGQAMRGVCGCESGREDEEEEMRGEGSIWQVGWQHCQCSAVQCSD